MSKFVNGVVLGLVVFVLSLSAFWYVDEIRGPRGVTADSVDSEWGTVDVQMTEIRTSVQFQNPRKTPAQLVELQYEVLMDGVPMDNGTRTQSLVIPPGDNRTVDFTARFPTTFVTAWLGSFAQRGETSELVVRGRGLIQVAQERISVPFSTESNGQWPLASALADGLDNCPSEPTWPCIAAAGTQWSVGTAAAPTLRLSLEFRNPNASTVHLDNLRLGLRMEGVNVASGAVSEPVRIEPTSSTRVEVALPFEASGLGPWWPKHVSRCERSDTVVDVSFTKEEQWPPPSENESGRMEVQDVRWTLAGQAFQTKFLCTEGGANSRTATAQATAALPIEFAAAGVSALARDGAAPPIAIVVLQALPSGEAIRTLLGNASMLLIVGGLAVLALILSLVVLQGFMPARSRVVVAEARPRPQLRPLAGAGSPVVFASRWRTDNGPRKPSVDRAVDQVVELGIGEPRILRHRPNYTLLRLYGCRTCHPQQASASLRRRIQGCPFEQEEIESAFRAAYGGEAIVREVSCRFDGKPDCEFEVVH